MSGLASWHSYIRSERRILFNEEQVDEIAAMFAALLAPDIAARALLFFVTDRTEPRRPITIFNAELFLASLEGKDAQFFRAFAQTMMFHEFIDRQIDETTSDLVAQSALIPERQDALDWATAERGTG
jgi:hypothetical protein